MTTDKSALQREFSELLAEDQRNIRMFSVKLGMSTREIRLLIGEPDEIRNGRPKHGLTWRYGPINKQRLMNFENDKLISSVKFN